MADGFETRAIHDGQPPDPAIGRGRHADHAVVDVRARGGRQALGLRVRAQRQPHPPRLRGVPGVARGRARRLRVRQRHGRRGRGAAAARARPARDHPRRRVRRHVPAGVEGARTGGHRVDRRRPHRPRRARARLARRHRAGVGRDADQPHAHHRRHPRACARSRTSAARASSSTTRSPRRSCSGRSSSAPTSSCTRPPSTSAVTPTSSAGSSATNDPEIAERVGFLQNAVGAVPSPFDCYLVLRGLKTLAVRMERHCENAQARSPRMLARHPAVSRVLYPGLADHPGPRRRAPPDARLRRDGELPRRSAARRPRSSSSPAPGCSRWPSRSAGSSRSSSTPPA